MSTAVALTTLPPKLLAGIGQVILSWARMEWLLSEITYQAGRIDPKVGRFVVDEPKAKSRVRRIQQLLNHRGISVVLDLDMIYAAIVEIEDQRNNLAHGVWCQTHLDRPPMLRLTAGNINSAALNLKGKTPRKFYPELVPFTEDDCREVSQKIGAICASLNGLRRELKHARPASPHKRQRQFDVLELRKRHHLPKR